MFKQFVAIILGVALIVTLIALVFTVNRVEQEKKDLAVDLEYRSAILAEGLLAGVQPLVPSSTPETLQTTIERLTDRERLAGISLYDNKENLLAESSSLSLTADSAPIKLIAAEAMDKNQAGSEFVGLDEKQLYVLALPLHQEERVIGALVVLQNADYIDAKLVKIWRDNLLRLFLQIFIFSVAIVLIAWLIIYRPVANLAESVRMLRAGKAVAGKIAKVPSVFQPLVAEFSKTMHSLSQARLSAQEEARLRLEKLDTPWTAERLKEFIKSFIKDRPIFMVSNREPYIHTRRDGSVKYFMPASGMVTAIEPMMEACGGLWLAHGSGDADRETVDQNGKIAVPPDEPKYTLKRLWLTEEEENGYYYGYANEGLWPLCHIAHTRPTFRKEDWEEYRKVNGKFAAALLAEIKKVENPLILVQDYHFALLPRLIKNSRPDAQIALFWHIPWPNSESFSICPQRKEILDGMLGADILGFHTQQHCNNFIDTVGKELEALIDLEQFAITRSNHTTYIKPFPISIAFAGDKASAPPEMTEEEKTDLLRDIGVESEFIGLGVDRLDYTKGIIERLRAVEDFLENNKEFLKKFTFIQIAPPSRDQIPRYREFGEEVKNEVERINKKFAANGWKPIVFLAKHHTHEELNRFYQIADVCLVTSLHDGMNLVAKEFISVRSDEQGVLILSQFAGASRELKDALIVNPYHIEQTSEAIRTALTMGPSEQKRRMKRMRNTIKNYNVYRWSAELLKAIVSLEP